MARRNLLCDTFVTFDVDLDLTIDDLMHDLDPGWDRWTPTAQASAADLATLLAALA